MKLTFPNRLCIFPWKKTLTFNAQLKFTYHCVDSGGSSHASKVSTKTIICYITQLCVSGITIVPHSRSSWFEYSVLELNPRMGTSLSISYPPHYSSMWRLILKSYPRSRATCCFTPYILRILCMQVPTPVVCGNILQVLQDAIESAVINIRCWSIPSCHLARLWIAILTFIILNMLVRWWYLKVHIGWRHWTALALYKNEPCFSVTLWCILGTGYAYDW